MDIDSLFKWNLTLVGPEGTPYEDGTFFVELNFPSNYPLSPPKVKFTSKIYHPSVKKDGTNAGELCKDAVADVWKSGGKGCVMDVVELLLQMMKTPPTDSPVESEIAAQVRNDPEKFKKIAKEWTETFASG